MIRVGIAEDQALVRESLAIVLNLQPDMRVAWTAADGAGAVKASSEAVVEVILMDLRMPGLDGVAAMRAIRAQHRETRFIVLTTFDHEEWLMDALNAGAAACFLKEVPPQLLVVAIRQIVSGTFVPETWSPHWRKYAPALQFRARVGLGGETNVLTARELEVIRYMCQGFTNAQIAAVIHLTEGTVKNYVSTIYDKLGVRHRTQAVYMAREKGLC